MTRQHARKNRSTFWANRLAGALALADIHPRGVASLSLLAPAGLGPEIDAEALSGIVRARRAESLAPWLRRLTATAETISDDHARAAVRTREDADLRACQADMAKVLFPDGVQAFDLRPALQRSDAPTQILWGRSDHILPHGQVHSVPGDFAIHPFGSRPPLVDRSRCDGRCAL